MNSMAQLIVTNLNDSGAGSLRNAIATANASVGIVDTIQFADNLSGTVVLTSGELALTDDVTITGDTTGDGRADITISGNNNSRIFHQTGIATNVNLLNLSLTAGNGSGGGGAVLVENGTVNIADTTIAGNHANDGGGVFLSLATATVTSSLIAYNTAGTFPDSVTSIGGGIFSTGSDLTISNTTIFANRATAFGGGVALFGGNTTIVNSTITGNGCNDQFYNPINDESGGIYASGNLTITNSVVAGNYDQLSGGGSDVAGPIANATHSVFGSAVNITTDNSSLTNVTDVGFALSGQPWRHD